MHRGEGIRGQEQPPRFRDPTEEGTRAVGPDTQPVFQGSPGTLFEKDPPFPVAFADNSEMRTVFIAADVRKPQTREFGTPQTPGVEDSEHGRVADTGRGGVGNQRLN